MLILLDYGYHKQIHFHLQCISSKWNTFELLNLPWVPFLWYQNLWKKKLKRYDWAPLTDNPQSFDLVRIKSAFHKGSLIPGCKLIATNVSGTFLWKILYRVPPPGVHDFGDLQVIRDCTKVETFQNFNLWSLLKRCDIINKQPMSAQKNFLLVCLLKDDTWPWVNNCG